MKARQRLTGAPTCLTLTGALIAGCGSSHSTSTALAIETYGINPERAKPMKFAGPYLMANYTVVVKKDKHHDHQAWFGSVPRLYDATVAKLTHKPAPTPPAIGSVPGT